MLSVVNKPFMLSVVNKPFMLSVVMLNVVTPLKLLPNFFSSTANEDKDKRLRAFLVPMLQNFFSSSSLTVHRQTG
jgi:hypothetical protein